jgi:hypothetical protein
MLETPLVVEEKMAGDSSDNSARTDTGASDNNRRAVQKKPSR